MGEEIPLLAEEGWTRHEENVPLPIWRGRGGQFGEIFRPEHFAKLPLRLRPIGLALRVLRLRPLLRLRAIGLALRATPSAALRWLRDFLLMPQLPLLTRRGMCAQTEQFANSFTTLCWYRFFCYTRLVKQSAPGSFLLIRYQFETSPAAAQRV